jgi:hypothetical protein
MALVRRSLIATLHTGLPDNSVVAVAHTSSSMGLADIVELDRIAAQRHIENWRPEEAVLGQMCTKGDSSP